MKVETNNLTGYGVHVNLSGLMTINFNKVTSALNIDLDQPDHLPSLGS